MPYKLRITKEEVKAELKRMGYEDFPDEVVESFQKDLLKLIKNDLKKLKKLKQLQDEPPGPCSSSKLYETSMPSSYLELEKEKTRYCQEVSSEGSSQSLSSEKASKLSLTTSEYLPKSEETEETEEPSGSSASVKTKDRQKLHELNKRKEVELPSYPDRPDPVNLYHYYKAHWDKFKVPGEDPRRALRWGVRSKLFYSS